MPIHRSSDKHGTYYQWGSQAKYYYIPGNEKSRIKALNKCRRQMRAIEWSINHSLSKFKN